MGNQDRPAAGPAIGADTPTTDLPLSIDVQVDAARNRVDVPLGAGEVFATAEEASP